MKSAFSDLTLITQRTRPDGRGLTDCIHPGSIAWVDASGQLLQRSHEPRQPVFLRSCAKLFQALPLVISGAYQQLTTEQLAITCASHTGSAYHQQLVQHILDKAGLDSNHLQCGTHPAIDRTERHRCIRQQESPAALHHNCSGKHAGMLLTCVHNGWPIDSYLERDHPLQRAIVEQLLHLGGMKPTDLQTAIDGCGVPTFYIPIQLVATLFAQWSHTSVSNPLQSAITENPVAFGGEDRVDSALVKATHGRIIAKVGADGLLAACHTQRHEGIAYKIHSGHDVYRNVAFCHLLHHMGWISNKEWSHPTLSPHTETTLKNAAGQTVGQLLIHLPPFT